MEKKKDIGGKIILVAAVSALTAAGFIFIPPLLQKCGTKAYKASVKKDEINFDDMGPEIIPFEENQEEE